MVPPALFLFLALAPAPLQVPDTTRPAPDSLAVVLPLAAPPAGAISVSPQQARPDTTRAASADTLPAASPGTPPVAPSTASDTTAAGTESALRREVERLQIALDRHLSQFRSAFTLTRLLLAVLALAFTYLVTRLATWLLERIARWRPPYAYRIRRVIPLVKFVLWFAAVWIVVGSLFAGSTVVLVLLVLVVATAAGATSLQFLRDLAGGLTLTFEQPFQIGSRVTVGDHTGVVKQIGLRSFELATPDGSVAVIPNAEVLRRSLTATPPDVLEAPVTVELTVPETVDPDEARALVREAAYASPYLFAAGPVRVALTAPEGTAGRLRLQVEAYVFDARYAQALANDVVRLAHGAFAQAAGAASEG